MTGDALDPRPRWGEVGIHGVHRLREWDAVVTAHAPEVAGDEVDAVVLAGDTHPFVPALAGTLEPPYRLKAVRRDGGRWAVAARRIDVASLPGVPGDELLLTVREGETALEIDGMPTITGVERVLAAADVDATSYVVRARRVRDDAWELDVALL